MELEESTFLTSYFIYIHILYTLQSYKHQDSMALAQKQKHGAVEQDRKPRNKPMHQWVPYF